LTVTPGGGAREGASQDLLDNTAARLRRATLLPVVLLIPLIFLPLRTPTDLLATRSLNVALHLAATLLLFALVRRLRARALVAPAAALLFAVHPVHVEAVAVARAELLATVLSLAALLSLSHAGPWRVGEGIVVPGATARRAAAFLAGLCLFSGLTVSASALAVPALLLGLECLFRPRREPRAPGWWRTRAPALLPAVLAFLAHLAMRSAAVSSDPHVSSSAGEGDGLASGLALLARHIGSLFYPVNLTAHPTRTFETSPTDVLQLLPWVGVIVLAGLVWLSARPLFGKRRSDFGSLASFATLLFVMPYTVAATRSSLGWIDFTERYLYFPSVGFCLLLALAIGAVSTGWSPGAQHRQSGPGSGGQIRLAAFTLAAMILGFSILTWARCLEWRGERPTQETVSRTIRVGENGSSGSGTLPSTIQRVR